MSEEIKYFKIEENIFRKVGKIGYIFAFVLLGILIMSIINFILFCFIDNYYTFKFVFTREMDISAWINIIWDSYKFPYIKLLFFALIFLFLGIFRSRSLAKVFSK